MHASERVAYTHINETGPHRKKKFCLWGDTTMRKFRICKGGSGAFSGLLAILRSMKWLSCGIQGIQGFQSSNLYLNQLPLKIEWVVPLCLLMGICFLRLCAALYIEHRVFLLNPECLGSVFRAQCVTPVWFALRVRCMNGIEQVNTACWS
jgi:hypothetical protein